MIAADSHFQVMALVAAIAAFAFWVDRTRFGKIVPGLTVAIFLSMLLSNTGLAPRAAPVYDMVSGYLVPMAVVLLLLQADFGRILKESGGTLVAFLAGALGAALGAFLGVLVLPLGEDGPGLAAMFSATYIGGSMNMAAMAEAVDLDDTLISASVAADNIVTAVYLLLLTALSGLNLFVRWFSPVAKPDMAAESSASAMADGGKIALSPLALSWLLFLALAICALGKLLASQLGLHSYSILFITIIALAAANFLPRRWVDAAAAEMVGVVFMYLFFSVVGAGADFAAMFGGAGQIVLYAGLIVAVHFLVLLLAGRMFRFGFAEAIIASNACISGPGTAAAFATGKYWRDLVTPGVLCGVLGYAIGNFVGLGLQGLLAAASV